MKVYSMFLDDLRIASNHYETGDQMVTVRTYYDAVAYVNEHGLPDFISFDHDLGDSAVPEMTGYDFAKFLIEYMLDNNIRTPFDYLIHSANPVGEQNIRYYLENGFTAAKNM